MTEGKLLFSVDEAIAMLSISRSSFFLLLNSGRLASVKLGKRRLIPRQALEDFVDSLPAFSDFDAAPPNTAARKEARIG